MSKTSIIGHHDQLSYLEKVIESDNTPHFFIFSGPDYIGKKLIAKAFFWRLMSGEKNWQGIFKEDDRDAALIRNNSHPDFFFVEREEEKKDISIEQTRKLKNFVGLRPFGLKGKLVLVDEAQRLNKEAFNSLLKTLEEPSEDTVIILITSQTSKIPKTLISRSVVVKFWPVPDKVIKKSLGEKTIDKENWPWIAGRPGLALGLLKKDKESPAFVIKEQFFSSLKVFKGDSLEERMLLAGEVADNPLLSEIIATWVLALRHVIMSEDKKEFPSFAGSLKKLKTLRQVILNTNANKRLQLEAALASL